MQSLHQDLIDTENLIYKPAQLRHSTLILETESTDYGACHFEMNNFKIRFRAARKTPKKNGLFVTLWKRIGSGPIQPYDIADPVDFFVISTRNNESFGQFVFPKSVLLEKNIFSQGGNGGKRGIRVYPSWDKPTSKQVQKTQTWQLRYFLEVPINEPVDHDRIKMLYQKPPVQN